MPFFLITLFACAPLIPDGPLEIVEVGAYSEGSLDYMNGYSCADSLQSDMLTSQAGGNRAVYRHFPRIHRFGHDLLLDDAFDYSTGGLLLATTQGCNRGYKLQAVSIEAEDGMLQVEYELIGEETFLTWASTYLHLSVYALPSDRIRGIEAILLPEESP